MNNQDREGYRPSRPQLLIDSFVHNEYRMQRLALGDPMVTALIEGTIDHFDPSEQNELVIKVLDGLVVTDSKWVSEKDNRKHLALLEVLRSSDFTKLKSDRVYATLISKAESYQPENDSYSLVPGNLLTAGEVLANYLPTPFYIGENMEEMFKDRFDTAFRSMQAKLTSYRSGDAKKDARNIRLATQTIPEETNRLKGIFKDTAERYDRQNAEADLQNTLPSFADQIIRAIEVDGARKLEILELARSKAWPELFKIIMEIRYPLIAGIMGTDASFYQKKLDRGLTIGGIAEDYMANYVIRKSEAEFAAVTDSEELEKLDDYQDGRVEREAYKLDEFFVTLGFLKRLGYTPEEALGLLFDQRKS